jgi:hypothetical protein
MKKMSSLAPHLQTNLQIELLAHLAFVQRIRAMTHVRGLHHPGVVRPPTLPSNIYSKQSLAPVNKHAPTPQSHITLDGIS